MRDRINNENVLHIINGEYFSGAERVQDLLANKLGEYGYDTYIGCVKPYNFKKFCTYNKDKIYNFPMSSRVDFRCVVNIIRFVKDKEIKLLHSHTPRTLMIGVVVAKALNLPLVHHLHSPTDNDSTNKMKNKINDFIESFCLKKASAIIPVSESLEKYLLKKGVQKEKIFIVHNGVPAAQNLAKAKEREDTFIVGIVALLRERKGFDVLIKAIANLICKKQYNLRILAVGTFETEAYELKIKELLESLNIADKIIWAGFKHNVEEQFRKMDLFVLPSLFGEGTPMVILEAMAFGVPILSTRVEGIPEVIRNKTEGLLVDPNSIAQMEESIEMVINKRIDVHTIRINAYNQQKSHFSDISMADKVSKVYTQLLQDIKKWNQLKLQILT
ncbi:glycosyltransferase family 4 protein [uncultured Desulfobacter sp.]|uniref:glycosyltransferase family 4 protein n=1 Tax=uncultured Desulfobacter sp. TaxID=240139 RepID=UPI0029F58BC4|nr:glycosyltransferase family 4 protein [uncultured Desulfobacter sp.]